MEWINRFITKYLMINVTSITLRFDLLFGGFYKADKYNLLSLIDFLITRKQSGLRPMES